MIKIRGKIGEDDSSNKIVFSPRAGFTKGKKSVEEKEFPLIYGHKCPICSNVIQALFKASNTFSLWPYEETVLLSQGEKNAGDVRRIVPDETTKLGKSCYAISFRPAEGGSVKITLKNHIVQHLAIDVRDFTGDGLWDSSAHKPCTHAGLFSLREDLLVKDILLFSQTSPLFPIERFNLPSLEKLLKPLVPADNPFREVSAIGKVPSVIMVDRSTLVFGYHTEIVRRLAPYRK